MNIQIDKCISQLIKIKEEQLLQLKDLSKSVQDFKSVEFDMTNLDDFPFDIIDLEHVVYLICIKDFGAFENSKSIQNFVLKAKKDFKKIKLPAVNNEVASSNVLYIGKSTGNFATRMKQHLLCTSKLTYTLQLNEWKGFKGYKTGLSFTLHYSNLPKEQMDLFKHTEKKDLVELIENALQLHYTPLLGRTGH